MSLGGLAEMAKSFGLNYNFEKFKRWAGKTSESDTEIKSGKFYTFYLFYVLVISQPLLQPSRQAFQ